MSKKPKQEVGEEKLTVEMLQRILSNPFYCINISESLIGEHEQMVSEETWVEAGVQGIKQDGDNGRNFLKNLLENLKGNYI